MNSVLEKNILTIFLEGKIESSNAKSIEEEIDAIIQNSQFESLIFNAENLFYISSAGLRIILKFKKLYQNLKIINASTDVYEIFDMTGFTQMIDIKKAYRQMSVDGCEIIGKGAKGTVYRYSDDTVIKVFHNLDSIESIENEIKLARKAFVLGIPTAIPFDIVKVDGLFGSVFELLNAKSYSELLIEEPENFDKYVKKFAELLKNIHDTDVSGENMDSVKTTIDRWLNNVKKYCSDDLFYKISKKIDDIPDTYNMLHCDFHTNNVMMQNGETLLIDMDSMCHGHPIFELANVYITYVGFGLISHSYIENFIGLSYEKTTELWDKFLHYYFADKNESEINQIEKKVILISYLRLINHIVKRYDSDEGLKIIEKCVDEIKNNIDSFDNLYF